MERSDRVKLPPGGKEMTALLDVTLHHIATIRPVVNEYLIHRTVIASVRLISHERLYWQLYAMLRVDIEMEGLYPVRK